MEKITRCTKDQKNPINRHQRKNASDKSEPHCVTGKQMLASNRITMPTSNGMPQARSAHIFAFGITKLGTAELAIPPSELNGELGGPARQEMNQRIREGRFPSKGRVRGFRRMALHLRGLSPQLEEGERCRIASSLCVCCDSDSSCDAVEKRNL